MVAQKRLGYGSRGRQIPAMPRVPNSVRGKCTTRRKKNEMCAFDLLATIAGTLLEDQDSSPNVLNTSGAAISYTRNRKSVKEEYFDEILPLRNVAVRKGCCSGCGSGGVSALPRQVNDCLAENSSTRNEAESVLESLTVKSNMLVRNSSVRCARPCEISRGLGIIREYGASGVRGPGSSSSAEAGQAHQAEPKMIRRQADRHAAALDSLFASVDLDGRPPALVTSDSSSGVLLCSHDKEHKATSLCQVEVQHTADRDDDERFSGCTHPSTTGNEGYKPHYVGNHRIRKLLASKVRKGAHNKSCRGMSNKGSKLNFCGKKIPTARQKVQRTNFKRKKLARGTTPFAKGMLAGASGTSFTTEGQNKSCGSEDYHVKLRIKSFNIPELFVEIPETATIGSLKQDSSSGVIIPEEMDFISADIVEQLARIKYEEPFPETKVGGNQKPIQAYLNGSLTGCVHHSVEMTSQDTSASLQAIIPVAASDLNALAIVPICKTRRSEIGQRRTRMPFSVGEVEALVEAVEQLGTGRWRDVKMHAFDGADHRTYVDLKDKWKTLVHTASISPQQRRGEPVPQELLDRVLSAQAYWSQQQAKFHGKAPLPEICLASKE
ncbi:Telomere-binding protein 1 [Dichanthelium oligosanthes]|uniref:Telomere-binding protein 1 n=1 Tax=Dichanthelium oligosanthes TaxID=888268 RepID=A0A1E5WHI4_9POAL|nr:Telomere-binding protein 1 [Dichanthelium oligosanthes]